MLVRALGLGKVYPGVDGAPPVRVLDSVDLEARPGQVLVGFHERKSRYIGRLLDEDSLV